jgi:MFS family permease
MASEVPTDPGRLDPRTRRSVVALLASVFCSSAAIAALTITLGKQVFDLTGRELDLGLLGLAEFAPALLLVFVTGPVADRFDRRTVGRIALVLAAACCLALTAYAGTEPTSTGPIFALVVAYGVARAFAMPATRSLPADTVVAARLPWLVARQSVTWQAAMIVGPVSAGFLYVVDVQLPFLLATVLLLVSAASLTFVHTDARDAELRARPAELATSSSRPTLHDAFEGIRFVRGHQVLLGVISLDLFAVLFGGAVALLPAIAEERLHVGAVGLGWLRAAVGIGAAAVTLVLTVRPVTRRVGTRLLFAVALFGVGTIVLGITTNYVVAWIALAVLSGADAVSVFIRGTLVPLVTPADKRGRVLAVEMVFIGASNELGAFESGVVGQLLGPAAAIVIGGAATVAVAVIWASRFPALRATDRFPSSIN